MSRFDTEEYVTSLRLSPWHTISVCRASKAGRGFVHLQLFVNVAGEDAPPAWAVGKQELVVTVEQVEALCLAVRTAAR